MIASARSRKCGLKPYFGQAAGKDVARVLADFDEIWPGIKGQYTGRALVSNWWDHPYSRGAFISPDIGAITSWWGAQLEREGYIHFAGEACDVEYWSYMNGAIRSGERVAQEIAQGLNGVGACTPQRLDPGRTEPASGQSPSCGR